MTSQKLTWGAVVDQRSQRDTVLPVALEVGDGHLGDLVLDPPQQPLLGSGLHFLLALLFVVPHGHGDGVVQDQGPDQTQDELQVAVDYGFAVCHEKTRCLFVICDSFIYLFYLYYKISDFVLFLIVLFIYFTYL